MKFLSNFDTQFETQVVEKYQAMYGKENVLSVHRAQIFLVMFLLAPISIIILSWIIIIILMFYGGEFSDPMMQNIRIWGLIIMGILITLYYLPGLFKKYVDYSMDFCVITPKEIVAYNQTGILNRSGRSVDTDKIKTISVDKKGFVKSLFNFGSIIFLSEGDSEEGDIELNYVSDPDTVKNNAKTLINEAYQFDRGEGKENLEKSQQDEPTKKSSKKIK